MRKPNSATKPGRCYKNMPATLVDRHAFSGGNQRRAAPDERGGGRRAESRRASRLDRGGRRRIARDRRDCRLVQRGFLSVPFSKTAHLVGLARRPSLSLAGCLRVLK